MTHHSDRIPKAPAESGENRTSLDLQRQNPSSTGTRRIPWYSFYFMLAAFIVIVLASHAFLFYESLTSYEQVVSHTARIRDKMRWLAHLRLAVDALDSPGNDIFETGESERESASFELWWQEIEALMERRREFDSDLTEFAGHLQLMADREREVLAQFVDNAKPATTAEEIGLVYRQVVSGMAAMDRHRVDATGSLTELEQLALTRIGRILRDHGQRLRMYSWTGRLFSLLAFGILLSLLWYGRRLLLVQADIVSARSSALRERQDRLAAVGELCSSVAHGIRNPLASISTSAQLLLETEPLEAKSSRRLEDILTECRRLAGRVAYLLQFASTPNENSQRYPLQQALDRAVSEVRPRLEMSKIAVSAQWCDEPLMVRGDPERMVLAVAEIMTNALDVLKSGGRIRLSCMRDNDSQEAVFEYADDGPGIPAELRTRVFELFFSTKAGGTGIGLATAKRAAELHGGDLMIVDSPPGGLRLRMRLPLVDINTE